MWLPTEILKAIMTKQFMFIATQLYQRWKFYTFVTFRWSGYPGVFKCLVADDHTHPSQEEHLVHLQECCCGCGCTGTNFISKRDRRKTIKMLFSARPAQPQNCKLVVPNNWNGQGGQMWSGQTQLGGSNIYQKYPFLWLRSQDGLWY